MASQPVAAAVSTASGRMMSYLYSAVAMQRCACEALTGGYLRDENCGIPPTARPYRAGGSGGRGDFGDHPKMGQPRKDQTFWHATEGAIRS